MSNHVSIYFLSVIFGGLKYDEESCTDGEKWCIMVVNHLLVLKSVVLGSSPVPDTKSLS